MRQYPLSKIARVANINLVVFSRVEYVYFVHGTGIELNEKSRLLAGF